MGKKKSVTIIKQQHGATYNFQYESITECARCLRVAPETVFQAYYTQHKCKGFEIRMKPKKNFKPVNFIIDYGR